METKSALLHEQTIELGNTGCLIEDLRGVVGKLN